LCALVSSNLIDIATFHSIKVTNHEKLKEAAVTDEDREYLAEALARAYLRQFCTHKFFSTDPHPGNLGIEVFDDGRLPRMVFYDFGQACSLSHDQAYGILEVVSAPTCCSAKLHLQNFLKIDTDCLPNRLSPSLI
jgi:predicted unusual protein kinase regulating ubiquinone biosynthesis (AarF/ABC1/UbiB family)